MWRSFLIAALALCALRVCLGDEFPYEAYVTSADVYVRSGPGRDYYPTDKLPKGCKVEVYRHDPGGWHAIRPPRGSFAWVSRRHLTLDGDGVATVNAERVVARVGSTFSDVRDVIQVRLDKDEKVEIIEHPSDDSTWCKIAPPSGEFRWVFSKFVDRELPADLAADQREAGDSGVRLASGEEAAQPTDQAGSQQATQPPASKSATDRVLDSLEMELSAVVVQNIDQWSFGDLGKRAEETLRTANTTLERGRARVLLSKLARFDDIKARHDALRARGTLDQRFGTATSGAPVSQAPQDASRYDSVGRLSPVISEKVGGPQYALVDAQNAVVSFITPAPGVNLRPYVDQYVGVNGQRGYLTDLQRQHISVQRVTVLEVQRQASAGTAPIR